MVELRKNGSIAPITQIGLTGNTEEKLTEIVPQRSVLYGPLTFTPSMTLKSAETVMLKTKQKTAKFV